MLLFKENTKEEILSEISNSSNIKYIIKVFDKKYLVPSNSNHLNDLFKNLYNEQNILKYIKYNLKLWEKNVIGLKFSEVNIYYLKFFLIKLKKNNTILYYFKYYQVLDKKEYFFQKLINNILKKNINREKLFFSKFFNKKNYKYKLNNESNIFYNLDLLFKMKNYYFKLKKINIILINKLLLKMINENSSMLDINKKLIDINIKNIKPILFYKNNKINVWNNGSINYINITN